MSPLEPLATRDGEPAFEEPWQAQVLALAHNLTQRGAFTATAWSEALGAELKAAAARGEPDTQATYYAAALVALEGLLAKAGSVTPAALDGRTEDWREAYLHTPHGKPVELRRAD